MEFGVGREERGTASNTVVDTRLVVVGVLSHMRPLRSCPSPASVFLLPIIGSLIGWFIGSLVDWLVGWLIGWLVG
jgi:hypothetical protein